MGLFPDYTEAKREVRRLPSRLPISQVNFLIRVQTMVPIARKYGSRHEQYNTEDEILVQRRTWLRQTEEAYEVPGIIRGRSSRRLARSDTSYRSAGPYLE